MSSMSCVAGGSSQGNENWLVPVRDNSGGNSLMQRCFKESNQTMSGSSAVLDMVMSLKPASRFSFSYDIMYSTTGLLVGCQFALTFGGTFVGGGYGITLVTIGNTVVSDATTTFGTFIGSGATVAGGGPRCARIFGSVTTGGTIGGDLNLFAQPTGVAATLTILANSTCKAEEQ